MIVAISLLLANGLNTSLNKAEETVCRRIENHLILKDHPQAVLEAEEAALNFPQSQIVLEGLIKVYARIGEEQKMLAAFANWKRGAAEKVPRRIYEEMCWGVIEKGEKSGSPMIRTIALLAAFWGQDARGVKVIERRLKDSNFLVKQAAAEVAARIPDERIKLAIISQFNQETDWQTKLELIRAIGTLKIKSMKPVLLNLIADTKSTIEEKSAASEALLHMLEKVPRPELESLAHSERIGLRKLAAELITFLNEKESIDLLWQLTQDDQAQVRAQALLGLGVLRAPFDARMTSFLYEREFHVGLAAAYTILLTGSQAANVWIKDALIQQKPENARLVAAMLGSSGIYGMTLAKTSLPIAKDFYVKMNLALALLDKPSLDIIYNGLFTNKERWSREKNGVFSLLKPSDARHRPLIPNWPEVQNKETRLEILSLLAMKEHPKALDAAREFLKDKGWGISGLTSALLLSEGEEKEVELIRPLLRDSDADIRLQAALILSRWDPEEVSEQILTENYDALSREKKEIVLQALGALGNEGAINFLVKEMGSPYASLRLIASASLIKCLYE